jgi:fumarylacetoacetate (FAA) hydrolase
VVTDLSAAVDFEAELAAIIGPVSMGAGRMEAESALRLLMLCNDVSLRRLVSDDLQRGFGFFHAKPATGFGPVAVTPDELAPYWRDGRLHLTAEIDVNERSIGRLDMADGVDFDLADITGEAARTRRLSAGTIVGSGTISNPHDEILPLRKDAKGFACIAEARMMERLKYDRARTSFLKQGDRVRISVVTGDGTRPMGTILQTVETA